MQSVAESWAGLSGAPGAETCPGSCVATSWPVSQDEKRLGRWRQLCGDVGEVPRSRHGSGWGGGGEGPCKQAGQVWDAGLCPSPSASSRVSEAPNPFLVLKSQPLPRHVCAGCPWDEPSVVFTRRVAPGTGSPILASVSLWTARRGWSSVSNSIQSACSSEVAVFWARETLILSRG